MKKFLAISIALLFASSIQAQTTFIVNNNPGAVLGVNVHTNFNAAQTAASDGDIIYIVPSGTQYGTLNITKEITVFGIGLYPDNQTSITSDVPNIIINASNVRISGIKTTFVTSNGNSIKIQPNVVNTTIDNCYFKKFDANETGIANIIIQNCVITENSNHAADGLVNFHTSTPNIKISNNIVFANQNVSQFGVFYSLNAATIENNLFIGPTSGSTRRIIGSITNCSIKNNIFYGVNTTPRSTFTGNDIDYNLTFDGASNSFAAGNTIGPNNKINQDPMFVNVPYTTIWSINYDVSLMPGSPAIGGGEDGTDIGLTGGGVPFDPTATSLPIIQSLSAPSMISQGSLLPVKVKGRGN